jgi:hypothetical protein
MRITFVLPVAYLVVVSGSAAQDNHFRPLTKSVTVDIKSANNQVVGKAVLSPAQPHGAKLDLNITNLPPGKTRFSHSPEGGLRPIGGVQHGWFAIRPHRRNVRQRTPFRA